MPYYPEMIPLRSITLLCSIAMSMLVAMSILGLLNLSIGSNVTADQNDVRQSLGQQNYKQGSLQVLNTQISKTLMGNMVIKGQVMNYGTVKINYAVINVDFVDKNGNILYSGPVSINDINPGEKKDFEVTYYGPEDKLYSFRISSNVLA